jgi:hypothetical protein
MSATRTAKVADGRSVPPERVTAAFAVSAAAAALLAAHGRADVGTPPGLSVSSNWSGYVATGPAFSGVSGSWTVPSTNCFGQAPQHTAASFWVGLGGALPTSHKIEQIGTAAGCNTDGSANYYAWYELWPRRAVGLSLDIEPGDRMHASVRLRSGGVELALADLTSGRRFVQHLTLVQPDASSAEWIGEAPMLVVEHLRALEPLTKFGGVTFSGASATSNGHTAPIGDAAWRATPVRLGNPKRPKVVPTPLDRAGSSFSLTVRPG